LERADRNLGRAQRHPRAARCIAHPRGQFAQNTGFHLDKEHVFGATIRPLHNVDLTTGKRMPMVLNANMPKTVCGILFDQPI